MAFTLTRLHPSTRQRKRADFPDKPRQSVLACADGLRLEFDTDASLAGWKSAPEKASDANLRIIVYGRPLSPGAKGCDGDDETRGSEPVSAEELAALVAQRGFAAVENLRGSFIFLAAAVNADRVDCFRSRAGGRTCFWARWPGGWAVSDSAAEVARAGRLPEDPRWLARFFSLSNRLPAGLTPFEGVKELMPGEYLTINDDSIDTVRKPLALTLDSEPRRIPEWVDAFGTRLNRAVADCVPVNRTVAIMLSGGMDSGPVAAIASEIAKVHGTPLHAVSWRIRGLPESDEWRWISMLARHLGIRLFEIDAEEHLPFSRLDASQVVSDSPMYNAFRPLIQTCYASARQLGCDVVLNASSGDALYPHPNRALVDDLIHADFRSAARRLGAVFQNYGPQRLHRAPELRGLVRALIPRRRLRKHPAPAWLTDSARRQLQEPDPWPPECRRSRHPDFCRQLFGVAAAGGVARELRFSQRHGVDRRDPYLDPALRGLMARMPHALIHRDGTNKWIAREAMRGRLPEAFRTKPRTGRLNAFFNDGFDRQRGEIRALLMDHRDLWSPWVDPGYLHATLNGASSEERPRLVAAACIGYVLWKVRLAQS